MTVYFTNLQYTTITTSFGWFLKFLCNKFYYISSQNIWWLLRQFWKPSLFMSNCCGYFLGNLSTFYFNIWSHWTQCKNPWGATVVYRKSRPQNEQARLLRLSFTIERLSPPTILPWSKIVNSVTRLFIRLLWAGRIRNTIYH